MRHEGFGPGSPRGDRSTAKEVINMSDENKQEQTTSDYVPKVSLGNVPFTIIEETHDFVNEHGFSNLTMELILMASEASVKMTEAIRALSKLEEAKRDFLWHQENPPD